jgi:predicted PhzF superfamily epimerase YddE/YHI9
MHRRFAQVDVFGVRPGTGNPVAVVLDGDGIAARRMQELATWLNVRAFCPVQGSMVEDPVCGSFNAGLAQWLPGVGTMQLPCDVHQGAALGRAGRMHVSTQDEAIWITGATRTLIEGTLRDWPEFASDEGELYR